MEVVYSTDPPGRADLPSPATTVTLREQQGPWAYVISTGNNNKILRTAITITHQPATPSDTQLTRSDLSSAEQYKNQSKKSPGTVSLE